MLSNSAASLTRPWGITTCLTATVNACVLARVQQNKEILRLNGIYTGILTRAGVEIIKVFHGPPLHVCLQPRPASPLVLP